MGCACRVYSEEREKGIGLGSGGMRRDYLGSNCSNWFMRVLGVDPR